MRARIRRRIRWCGSLERLGKRAATLFVLVLAQANVPTALAAQETSPPDAEKPWLQWLLALVFVGLCCGVAFKNPKRSHMT